MLVSYCFLESLLKSQGMNVMRAGILGAHAVLFATSMCIIFVDLIEGNRVFSQWYTYLVSPCQQLMHSGQPPYNLTAVTLEDAVVYVVLQNNAYTCCYDAPECLCRL